MPIIKSDIRLIDGDVFSAFETIKEYLSHVGYEVDHEEITQNFADVKARIFQQSVLKLYLTNSPQIVHFHLEKKSDDQIQIETKCDLFGRFRFFYFALLILLLIGGNAFLIMVLTFDSKLISPVAVTHISMGSPILMTVLCFVAACFFYMRSISTFPYENFMNQFYDLLGNKGFSSKIDIHVGHSFPDMWKALFLIIVFFLPILFCIIITIIVLEYTFSSLFLCGLLSIIGLFGILLVLMNFQPAIKTKVFFTLIGFSSCIPILFYFSPAAISSVTGDLGEFFQKYQNAGYPQQVIKYGATFYLLSIGALMIVACVSLMSTFLLPIRIIMQLDKASTTHPASAFNQSFRSENNMGFNFLLVLLWGILWIVKILSLYFSVTILERLILGSNYAFNFTLAIYFFENIKTSLFILFQSKIDFNYILIFHRIIMLIYSAPMVAFVFLILRKNLNSSLEDYSLAGKRSENYKKIEEKISKQTKKICEFAGIRLPIIRVINSKDINAETKYLGFPLFKNILVVSEGAWDELNDKEDELDVMLAHEIWHIKKHTLPRRVLCFFSDYSLFGNGFLALLQNTFQIEREADNFAIKWIIKKYQNKNMAINLLKSLLERIEETNWKNAIFQPSSSLNFAMFKENYCRSSILKMFNESSEIQKAEINLKLFFQIYFGEEIISYFHPSINQRIAWTQEKYGTKKTN